MLSCAECDVELGRSGAMYCSSRCKDRARRVPCQFCGELKHTNAEGRKSGFTTCHGCIKDRAPHNASRYNRRGCRCDVCTADASREVREYTQRNDYWNRPGVVAARKANRSTPEGKVAARAQWSRWYSTPEGKASSRANSRRRYALKMLARVSTFSSAQLELRLSMAGGRCWICRERLPADFHVDHVKPLSRGGPHMLANLRPACPPCNLSKNNTWPFAA